MLFVSFSKPWSCVTQLGFDKDKKLAILTVVSKPNKINMDFQHIICKHVLHYLPAKSLYRFKAVCRDWKLMISTRIFEQKQSVTFHSISGLFCQTPEGSISFISLDPMAYGVPDPELKFLPEPVDLLASSNGLLCCRGRSVEKAYYICNPANQQWKKLPKPKADHGQKPPLVLAFEPSVVLNSVVDYKLICAFPATDFDDAYDFEIYSSAENSWKISGEIFYDESRLKLSADGIHVNGVVYWFSNNFGIICFDIKKNRVWVIPSPSFCGNKPFHWSNMGTMGNVGGKLSVSCKMRWQVTVNVLSNEYACTMPWKAGRKTWETKWVGPLYEPHPDLIGPEDVIHWAVGSDVIGPEDGILLAVGSDVIVFPHMNNICCYHLGSTETNKVTTMSNIEFSDRNVYVPYVNSIVRLE